MKRRNFLQGTSVILLGSLAFGCRPQATPIKIELLKDSVPVQMVSKFRQEFSNPQAINFIPQARLKDLYNLLQRETENPEADQSLLQYLYNLLGWEKENAADQSRSDLVMIGDYWLTEAIQQGLVQPLDPKAWERWNQLPPQWQALVTRNRQGKLDPEGEVWGAPYRWGTTVIAYRRDQFESLGWTPQDWGDLWREEIRDRFSVLNSPRETIGLTLKKLGSSYNTTNLDQVDGLEEELRQLNRRVKLYDSDTYLKPLITGDTWLAVGWSTDFPEKFRRQHNIGVVVPASGTALWADVWVQPASEKPVSEIPLAQAWIDFCWRPEIATQMSLLTGTTSPIVVKMNPKDLPETLQTNPLLLPKAEILDRSEFLLPLEESTLKQYQSLWQEMRQKR
ncbi:extracellular solute-binding protein [Capilliphycus salinus ALCB114379]|uniref:extracellular solute-binding protein n=1 Tax=Capilliphycus salinus TaxID=2768948 RepID=UPI0039A44793